MKSKYAIGDKVIISKTLTKNGNWVTTEKKIAEILDINYTVTFGPAHVIAVDGIKFHTCYWESDIDGIFHESR